VKKIAERWVFDFISSNFLVSVWTDNRRLENQIR
jgi:hypothetical protein